MDLERGFIVEITTRLRHGPHTSTTHYLATAHYDADEIYSGSPRTVGIIRNIGELKREVGNPLPQGESVTFVIEDTRGSFGLDKRFKDLLEKEEIIEQALVIKSFRKPVESAGVVGDVIIEFTGKTKRVAIDNQNSALTLFAESDGLTVSYPQTVIDPNVDAFSDAPDNSIGKYLPIAFGTAEVRAIPVDRVISTISDYALTTTFGSTHTISGLTGYKLRDYNGEFVEIQSNTTGETKVIDEDSGAGSGAPTSSNISVSASGGHIAVKLNTSSTTNYGIWGGYWYFYDNGGSTVNGYFNFSLMVADELGQPGEVIARGKADKGTYTWTNGLAQRQVKFIFDQVRPLDPDKTYFLTYSENVQDGTSANLHDPVQYSGKTMEYWVEESANSWGKHYNAVEGAANDSRFALWGLKFTDRTSTTSSSNYSSVRIETSSGIIPDQPDPAIHNLPLIVEVGGLLDDSGGTVTGTASKLLDNGAEAAALLLEQDGESYDLTSYDCEEVIDTTYTRLVGGASNGRITSPQIIKELLYQSKCIAFRDSAGALAIHPYGYVAGDRKYITEQDCTLLEWRILEPQSVVTHTDFVYQRTVAPLPIEEFTLGNPRNYREVLEQQNSDGGDAASWTEDSYVLYGDKRLSRSVYELNWIQDTSSAEFLSEFYLTYFSRPTELVTIELPYFERDYRTIELMDIIELEHVDNINDSGTSPDGFTKYPVDAGVAHTEIVESKPWRMAKKYPMRVLSRSVTSDHRLVLRLKVLNNEQEIF